MTLEEWMRQKESLESDRTASEKQRQSEDRPAVYTVSEALMSSFDRICEGLPLTVGQTSHSGLQAEYIGVIRRVDESLDRVITAADIERETQYNIAHITETFGGWHAALEAAGIEIESQVRLEIARLYRELGHPPSPAEMNEHGYLSSTMVANTFDSYDQAVEQVVSTSDPTPYRDGLASHTARIVPAGTLLADYTDRLPAPAAVTERTGTALRRTRDSSTRVIETVATRVSEIDSPSALSGAALLPDAPTRSVQTVLPDTGESFGRLRETATDVSQERRDFLKYAGLSVTIAAGTSSSDVLFGSDSDPEYALSFGYGGIPLGSSGQSDGDSQAGAPAPQPTTTAEQTQTPADTQTPVTERTPTPTATTTPTPDDSTAGDNSTGSDSGTTSGTSDTDTTTDSDTSTSSGSTDSGSGSGGDTGDSDSGSGGDTGDSGSGSGGDTGDSDSGSGDDTGDSDSGSGDDTTSTEPNRYNADFNTAEQGYGEQGYGGATSA
ncbi:homing endonuclease associated repeat-containing protein [Haloarcula salinisoli]|uniref:Uncharacterized protein n=1 Tax=Haloarcula salinisoli TaxID=2487746 RepID=A0A8J7YES4_9EURY|nr:hypothetical protein [Halomicroarcula salinisoli]MBX0286455.1 hypothetical protein [Halomicroarcula salinisoli]MBX0302056.1 hypothetical protein [Halomicroarcula salinisoli]